MDRRGATIVALGAIIGLIDVCIDAESDLYPIGYKSWTEADQRRFVDACHAIADQLRRRLDRLEGPRCVHLYGFGRGTVCVRCGEDARESEVTS